MQEPDSIRLINHPSEEQPQPDLRIGALLLADGKLTESDIDRILRLQRTKGLRFGEAALRLNLIESDDLHRVLAKQYDFPHLSSSEHVSRELVVAYEPFHPCAEELRALRTQLQIGWSNNGTRRRLLTIVSPGAGEGRSYVAANLAVAFSQLGERTLLIDADLRRPRLHRIFGMSDRIGLSSILSGRADHSAIVPVAQFGKLSLLTAGARPPNPQELLSRGVLAALLRHIQADFDVVLLDTPPAMQFADARSVAFRAGSALVIARKDFTRLADAASVIRSMSETGARTVGTVFNVF
ncbi:MAG TPA: chain length determinant protein tyrosine kinase EpsG [Steroidobacteraceae bacterium]|nr:chain length determinant protein tyrosine kinase EpsG [Steroidobacteraceae bacterium]